MMRPIGILGGMSWVSTAHYYATLNRMVAERMGGLHSARILLNSVDFAPIARMQREDDWSGAGAVLADGVEVVSAELQNGLLHVDLHRSAPDSIVQTIPISRK